MLRKISIYNTAFSAILICFGVFLEWFMYYLFVIVAETALTPLFPLFILMHLVSVAIFSLGMYSASTIYRFGSNRNWLITTVILCFIFPVIGFISSCLLFVAISKHLWKRSDAYDDYEKYITYDYKPEKKHVDEDRIVEAVSAELMVQPLVDIMMEDDVKLRRGAVNVMKRLPKKDAVRLLKQSLSDKSVEIRFYAAVGLSEIESEINSNIEMAKKEIERVPDSINAYITLANSYSEYFECGILDDVTARYYLDLAIEGYYKICQMGGGNINILNSLGNLESKRGRISEAIAKFEKVCEIDPDNIYANVGIIELLYASGRVDEAAKRARKIIAKMPETKGPMRELVKFWAGKK